jgi:hypothetical protein
VNDTFAFAGLPLATHPLATVGSSIVISVTLKDPGETAYIDNTGAVTATVANSAAALSVTAAADAGTIADVNNANGPLRGFIAGVNGTTSIADTATTAKSSFTINNNPNNYKDPDGATNWDFNNAGNGTSIAVTVAGNFNGLATNGVTVVGAGAPTVTVGASTATFTVTRANVAAAPAATTVEVDMLASGNVSLGTSRVFGVSAVATPVVGAAETLTGNASWWTWSANAIQLMSPYFSTDNNSTVFSRFFFLNTGTSAASYSATCVAESGVTVTQNAVPTGSHTGTLNVGTTWIKSSDICSFSTGIRGSIIFTINAPASNIKGTYNNAINGASSASLPLERPYAGSTF